MTERLPPEVVDAFDRAQRDAVAVARRLRAELSEGTSERDAALRLRELCAEAGFDRWFHRPRVRFGGRSGLPNSPRRRLARGQLVEVDFGPARADAFADFGSCWVHGAGDGEPEPEVLRLARGLVRACCGYAGRHKTRGEMFVYAQAWATNRACDLGGASEVGHACLPPRGPWRHGWPRSALVAVHLRRHRLHWFNPHRLRGIFALRPQLRHEGRVLAFEEMVYVDPDGRRLLGRASLDEVGT